MVDVIGEPGLSAPSRSLFVVLGAETGSSTHATAARLARLQPSASICLLAGAGHGVFDDGEDLHTFLKGGARP